MTDAKVKTSHSKDRLSIKIVSILKKYWPFYIMLLPGVIWHIIFKYGPMYGALIAFKDYNIVDGILKSPWADPWYRYFEYFFRSPYFFQIMGNTLTISLLKLVFGMIPPVILAIMINECRISWFKRAIQTVTYMPHFLSWVIIYGILIAFFSQSTGLFNRWISEITGTTIPFLTDAKYFVSVIVGSSVWQGMGWGAIIYLAAITGIDPTFYEAATIDGCGRIKSILHITLPNLRSVFVMLLILNLGRILDAGFDQIYILQNPSVTSVSEIIDTWVFKTGLEQMEFSLASAVGLMKSLIGIVLVTTTNRLSRRWGEGLW